MSRAKTKEQAYENQEAGLTAELWEKWAQNGEAKGFREEARNRRLKRGSA